jgi:hypothetical protein
MLRHVLSGVTIALGSLLLTIHGPYLMQVLPHDGPSSSLLCHLALAARPIELRIISLININININAAALHTALTRPARHLNCRP